MDPHLLSNAPNNAVASHIFDALVTNDEQSQSDPRAWPRAGAPAATRTWTFKLRQTSFSDGTPFTAADAIASLKRATDIPSAASFRTYTRSHQGDAGARSAHAGDRDPAPDPLLPNSLSRIRIISAKFKDASTADFNSGRAAIGTGPSC